MCRTGFADDHYVEFSKSTQDKIVGTKEATAHVSSHDAPLRSASFSCVKDRKK